MIRLDNNGKGTWGKQAERSWNWQEESSLRKFPAQIQIVLLWSNPHRLIAPPAIATLWVASTIQQCIVRDIEDVLTELPISFCKYTQMTEAIGRRLKLWLSVCC